MFRRFLSQRPPSFLARASSQQQQQLEQQLLRQQQLRPSNSSPPLPATSVIEDILISGAKMTSAAHAFFETIVRPGDTVVDATCGNGFDALFLAERVGPKGTVYAFDIQKEAVEATRDRITSSLAASAAPRLVTVCACHSTLQEHVGSSKARLVVFNLGYLPQGDKKVTTRTSSTVAAVEAALEVVHSGGFVSILCYVGHEGGAQEYEEVKKIVSRLSTVFWVTSESRLLNRKLSPVWIQVYRR